MSASPQKRSRGKQVSEVIATFAGTINASAQEMTDKPHIIADCDIPFLKGVLEPYADMEYLKGSEISHADALRADALIIRTRTRCDGRLLDGTPVRLIATATIGHDHIDSPYCREHRIEIRTAAGCNARGVLQYVMAALAALARATAGTPAGRTLGVVGVRKRRIAHRPIRRALRIPGAALRPPKAKQDPAGDYTELNEMLPQCDIVTCHVPLSVNGDYPTKAMADASFFASMKPGRRVRQHLAGRDRRRRGPDRGPPLGPAVARRDRHMERRTAHQPRPGSDWPRWPRPTSPAIPFRAKPPERPLRSAPSADTTRCRLTTGTRRR